uniref:MalT-like TPR region domain-containing protein n=1 Tax=Trieres chinensis TaxID=1514140 RepID=A0A7S1Z0M6_TRICV|mmetsp:Transcript_14736/g.30221  ORF Transcript_14736/g.30221 Transcript_14736/m.30221 type:complete len:174 (+) Transcript_14736:73-594(+)|eukprot:CAMPEP_0183311378 /NCGR_PEP_ID=MMETSP0160_2-20130417/36571_1 /TAXON_ID=2839 ORGANISM="Odontella Sinensis, Strain Grunow 1884" /NCGR_SAMPLE_ID=MMETSP0160_2 /ASSEMBLY_ACC=CAM_ASM_000250 /LENGTH=173 /DNA_ID=CAMNT_0025475931 /DNA_START=20 /DNA_END=541 /DNA_ORIENTATION=-
MISGLRGLFRPAMSDEAKSYGIYALGNNYMEDRDWNKALKCFNEALVLQRKCLGEDDVITGRTLRQVGTCLMNLGEHFAALVALEEALYIHQKKHGEAHEGAAEIINDVWSLLHKKRLELNGTPDRVNMLRDMKKQKNKRALQSFLFKSVRGRGGNTFNTCISDEEGKDTARY